MSTADEVFGVAVVRIWKTEDRLLIRVVTAEELQPSNGDDRAFVTDSLDEAVAHIHSLLVAMAAGGDAPVTTQRDSRAEPQRRTRREDR
ncbi:hypothetical protein BH18ACT4_BH18ACT4_01380 [soil metagenome]